ncbi:MAG TPA: hypothetical protein VFL60_05245 [Gaiellaceae bacterium]|nr:hypothetical protein [Gaiellaceae bacterium]
MEQARELPEGHAERRPAYTVAGFLSAMAIAAALVGLVWHPLRLIPIATLLSLIAAAMSPRGNRLAMTALFICAGCFFFGMLIAVVTSRSLW